MLECGCDGDHLGAMYTVQVRKRRDPRFDGLNFVSGCF
jgi:hypothetical protein